MPNPIDLLGYRIRFMDEGSFRHLFYEIFATGSYFFQSDSANPLIFDCGANIGMSILFFKKLYPNARIQNGFGYQLQASNYLWPAG